MGEGSAHFSATLLGNSHDSLRVALFEDATCRMQKGSIMPMVAAEGSAPCEVWGLHLDARAPGEATQFGPTHLQLQLNGVIM